MRYWQCAKTHIGENGETVQKWSLRLLKYSENPNGEFWKYIDHRSILVHVDNHCIWWLKSEWVEDGCHRVMYIAPNEEYPDNLPNLKSIHRCKLPVELVESFKRTYTDKAHRDLFLYHCRD